MKQSFSLLTALAVFVSCQSTPKIGSNDIKNSETVGKNAEPFRPPYVEVYQHGMDELRFIAVAHEGGWGPTHITVDKVWEEFIPDLIILEGFPSAIGENPVRETSRANKLCSDLRSKMCDEGSYSIHYAVRKNVPYLGGEPTELEIKAALLAAGYGIEDLFGFYVVRQIPEWNREGTLHETGLPHRVDKFIQDYAASFQVKTNFDWQKFRVWYRRKTSKDFTVSEITTEDPAPISGPGTTEINRIARAVEGIRNEHLIATIKQAAEFHHHILVVYGQGHLFETRPDLRRIFGSAVESRQFVEPSETVH